MERGFMETGRWGDCLPRTSQVNPQLLYACVISVDTDYPRPAPEVFRSVFTLWLPAMSSPAPASSSAHGGAAGTGGPCVTSNCITSPLDTVPVTNGALATVVIPSNCTTAPPRPV